MWERILKVDENYDDNDDDDDDDEQNLTSESNSSTSLIVWTHITHRAKHKHVVV